MAAVPAPPGSLPWWEAHEERLARRRPRADGLTLERIVAEALDLVDAEGLDALTVRRLAARVGTSSASLYRHVASRDELLVLLVDHALGEVRLPGPGIDGRRRVELLAADLRRVLLAHPHVVPALRVAPLLGPNARRASDAGLAILLDAGFPPEVAVPAYLALIDYVLGSVVFDAARATQSLRGGDAARAGAGVDGMPTLVQHRRVLEAATSEEVFAFGVRSFLDGLAATHASSDR